MTQTTLDTYFKKIQLDNKIVTKPKKEPYLRQTTLFDFKKHKQESKMDQALLMMEKATQLDKQGMIKEAFEEYSKSHHIFLNMMINQEIENDESLFEALATMWNRMGEIRSLLKQTDTK